MRKRLAFSGAVLRAGVPLLACVAWGCGSSPSDERFAASTNDEYTEGTAQAVISAPADPDAGTTTTVDGGAFVDGGGGDGGGGDGGVASGTPSGAWSFDDCSPSSPFLVDSTGNGATAQHAKGGQCVPGIRGEAVAFHGKHDMVQIADEPQFTLSDRVAVAAWVEPTTVTGHHPIVLKRLDSTTSFSLGIHDGNAEFSVVLANGKTVRSRAPIDPNVWTHVAGLYDGHFLFLFLNGQQVGQVSARGLLRNVNAPIRIGATSQTQYFDGVIDEVWLSTNPVNGTDIAALSCVHRPSTLAVTPATSGPVAPDTLVHYAVTVTDNDIGSCQASQYFLQIPSFTPGGGGGGDAGGGTVGGGPVTDASVPLPLLDAAPPPPPPPPPPVPAPPPTTTDLTGLQINANPTFSNSVSPGNSFAFDVTVTGSEDAASGPHVIPFTLFSIFDTPADGSLVYELAPVTGCHVRTAQELAIRDTSVVDDPRRTSFDAPATDPSRGVWTFGRLMRDLAPTPESAPALTEQVFRSWLQNQTINGFQVAARPAMQSVVLDSWPRTPDGLLDLDRSPLRLLAIMNRVDLRDLSRGDAGEGRFVFGVLGAGANPEQFTVILEYRLPASTTDDVLGWANAWHALSTHPFPSEEYNAALEAITTRFARRGAAPGRPNGSALNALRTNEIALEPRWELRQFGLSAASGLLEPRGVDLTPDLGFNGSDRLARFVNQNAPAIIAEQFSVPAQFEGSPFLGGSVFNDLVAWTAPGILDNEARFHLSLNTCNGCHGSQETNTGFLQISPRFPGQSATLSPFMTGTTVSDPVTGAPRTLNDLGRRNADLKTLVCPSPPPPPGARAMAKGAPGTSIAKGIQRVH